MDCLGTFGVYGHRRLFNLKNVTEHEIAVTTPIFAGLANRIGVKLTLAICLVCYVLGVAGCAVSFLADNMAVLILLRALQGFGMVGTLLVNSHFS